MNEQLQKAILDLINGAKTFTIDQAPDAIQQYLVAELISKEITIALILFFIFVAVLFGFFIARKADDMAGFFYFFICSALFFMLAGLSCELTSYYQIKYAPKGYLLERVVEH